MKTRKKLNLRFIVCLLAIAAVLGIGVHVVHGVQNKRNASVLLSQADKAKEQADKAKEEADKAKENKDAGKEKEYRDKEKEFRAKEVEHLERFLGFRPEDINARARYGEALDEQAKKTGSVPGLRYAFFLLEDVLRRDPERRDLRRRQVDTAMALGKFPAALAHLDVLHKIAPKDAELERLMGRCYEFGRESDKAVTAYQMAIEHAPDQIDNYLRVAVLSRERNAEKANKALADMVNNNPKAFRAYLARAEYLLRYDAKSSSAVKQAKADVQKARELAPNEPDVVLAAADVARAEGTPDKAREILHQGIQAHPRDSRLYLALVALEVRNDQAKEALTLVRQGLKELPDHGDLLHALADLLVQSGELKEAEAIITRLGQMKYAPPLVDYLQARIDFRNSKWAEAKQILDRVHQQLGRLPGLEVQALLLLGQCHERLGNPDRAWRAYDQACKLDPLSVAAHYRAGSALLALPNRTDDALREFGHILVAPKVPAGMHALLARALIVCNLPLPPKDRRLEAIKRELTLAAKDAPDTPDLPVLQAEALLLEGPQQAAAARRLIEQARAAHPDEVGLWVASAQLAGRDEALRVLDQAQARPKLANRVELRLARLSYLMLPLAEAKPEARPKAVETVRATLAEMEKEAAKLAEEEKLSEDDHSRLRNGLADAHLRLGDMTEAERLWRQVAKQQPNNLGVRLALFDLALLGKDSAAMNDVLAEVRRIEGADGTFWRYAEAVRLLQQARPADKEEPSDRARRQLHEARQYLSEASSRRESWPRIPALEAEIDELEGRIPEAIDKYQEALRLGDRRPAIVRRTVQLLDAQGRSDEIKQVMNKLRDQENILLAAGLGKAVVERRLSDPDPASRDSEHALELARKLVPPNSKDYRDHLWLGRVELASGKQEEAEKSLRRACELGEKAPETWATLVAFLASTGKKKEAEQAIEQATKKLPAGPARLVALAACYESIGNLEKAEEHFLDALKAAREDGQMLRNLASFHLRHGQAGKAEPHLRTLLGPGSKLSAADVAWARRGLASVLAASSDRRRFEEALGLIEKNLAENKNSLADEHARALLLATRISHRKDARSLFEDLARRDRLSANERFTLAQLYVAEDNWPQAQLHLLTLLASPEGNNPNYLAYYARRLLEHGAVDDAAAQLAKLEKDQPDVPLTLEIKARVLQARGKDADAVAVIRDYARRKGADLARAGLLLEALGQKDGAKRLFLDAAEELLRQYVAQAGRPERFLALAAFLGRRHAVAEALSCCEQALQHKAAPEDVAQVMSGVLRLAHAPEHYWSRVEKALQNLLAQSPDSILLRICLADVYDLQKRFAEAEQVYWQALKKDGDNVIVLNNLAWLLAFSKESPARTKALAVIDKAIDLVGPSPELLDTRGVVHLMLGSSDRAIEDLQIAAAQAPSANHYFHLARALAAANKSSDARQKLAEAKNRGFNLKKLHPLERPLGQQLLDALSKS